MIDLMFLSQGGDSPCNLPELNENRFKMSSVLFIVYSTMKIKRLELQLWMFKYPSNKHIHGCCTIPNSTELQTVTFIPLQTSFAGGIIKMDIKHLQNLGCFFPIHQFLEL